MGKARLVLKVNRITYEELGISLPDGIKLIPGKSYSFENTPVCPSLSNTRLRFDKFEPTKTRVLCHFCFTGDLSPGEILPRLILHEQQLAQTQAVS
ncbi:MAG: hypothetical protein A2589_03670 [Candidatus Vogelbacteria bacterium RIFOXYD1_FULL_46_19]|uniref:Uncharacterized protein n=1 Tax=Candidatus Vogelbacteria bacterium RIFOXYD1_FULL_46_19 TaxID=1802439 RepID=A0A1G2QJ22_9BACT|nr:MAG: hypothetical protein A2589_03670 [Candidatus Vogelbacteria bacterium RIFOXYD1_FULL_46_19]